MWVGGGWGGGRGCRKVAEFDFVETHGQLAMTYRVQGCSLRANHHGALLITSMTQIINTYQEC